METNLSVVKNNFKELPNNIEAEQSVIGSILVTNEIFDDINVIISSVNFYDKLPKESHDIIMDYVLTENENFKIH